MKLIVGQLIFVSIFLIPLAMAFCDRKPTGATGDRSIADDKFLIYIEGNPSNYKPGKVYNISIQCDPILSFTSFTLAVESEDPQFNYPNNQEMVGRFDLVNNVETKYSTRCENMVESTSTNKKFRVDLYWTAPRNENSGCLLFRAGLVQNRIVWYVDDGLLTKRLCPEINDMNTQTVLQEKCCACDEAKYEIILERKWTHNTHPNDFPEEIHRTKFSEVIGASHINEYRFWENGMAASEGLKALAEHGATKDLEEEIKQHTLNDSIRTIIKAPGITHRNNGMGTTLANVRVDPTHHIISLVSKIIPSPDWIIGVAALELCLEDCTWVDKIVLNLYPWDIGTDAGPSYMSADEPKNPADVIRRITSSDPSDIRSPFFDESGKQMKPIATLYATKKKIYERKCENEFDEDNEYQDLECATHPWNSWTECSTKCGPGMQQRVRFYKDPSLAENYRCAKQLNQEQPCEGTDCNVPGIDDEEDSIYNTDESAECALSAWSEWSQCSKSCGKGIQTRTRDYLKRYATERCQRISFVNLYDTRNCFINKCGGSLGRNSYNNESPDDDNNNAYGVDNYGTDGDDQYNTNSRRPQSGGRWDKNINRYPNQQFGEQDSNQDGNYQNNYDATSLVNENDETLSGGYGSNLYNSERFIGQNQRASDRNTIVPQDRSNNNFLNQNTNRQNFGTRPNSRLPTNTPRTPYSGDIGLNAGNNPSQYDTQYGSNVEDKEPEFCLRKPFYTFKKCDFKEIINVNYWLYDADDGECKIFTSDNCDKNENKFNTLARCEEVCLRPHQNRLRAQDGYNDNSGGGGGIDDGYANYGSARSFGDAQSQIKPSWRNSDYTSRRYSAGSGFSAGRNRY